jgi:hypothetical protein
MRRSLAFSLQLALFGVQFVLGSPCEVGLIPEQIRSSLHKRYAGWNVVTPNALSTPDRETWLERYPKECPGIIKGNFSGSGDGYVLNLIKNKSGTIFQQIVLFQPTEEGFTPLEIVPPAATAIVVVLRKVPPGRHKPANDEKAISFKTDAIVISQIDARTIVYYWDGTRFRRRLTSE